MKILSTFIFALLLLSCSKTDDEDLKCYSFDIRQCRTDLFADFVSENESLETRESQMKAWLESENYEVKSIKLVEGFHQAVCEACDICPQEDRYFIQIDLEKTDANPDELRLFNYTEEPCGDHF